MTGKFCLECRSLEMVLSEEKNHCSKMLLPSHDEQACLNCDTEIENDHSCKKIWCSLAAYVHS